jgi:16S rRNA C967 or C1407 C5-methylase (RsmB/RsmF family)
MSRTFKIPAELVRTLRMGLYSQMGAAAHEIAQISDTKGREKHPDWYREPLANLDGVRALLSEIGWRERKRQSAIEVDPVAHKDALIAALQSQAAVHDDMIAEAEQVDRERAAQGKPPKAPATIARAEALAELIAGLGLALFDAEHDAVDVGETPVPDE